MSTSFCIKVCLYRTFKIVLHFFLCKISATAQCEYIVINQGRTSSKEFIIYNFQKVYILNIRFSMPLSRYHKTRNKYIRSFLNQLLSKLTIVIISDDHFLRE